MVSSLRTPSVRLLAALGLALSLVVPPLVLRAGSTHGLDAAPLAQAAHARPIVAAVPQHAIARRPVRATSGGRPQAEGAPPAARIVTPRAGPAQPVLVRAAGRPAVPPPPQPAADPPPPPAPVPAAPPPAAPAPPEPRVIAAATNRGHGRDHAPGQLKKDAAKDGAPGPPPAAAPTAPPAATDDGDEHSNDDGKGKANGHGNGNGNGHPGEHGGGKGH
jgi:hypothetical protein